ncbi:ATP-dependent Clp protease [Actinidia rufa]|uniref:ATP-dependent Clp protease n=1 Tax=Actinidia rufa TaxID=165716 RepID=A0A7J0F9U6_9ERIC|nr:ATP-dependent Clp protease [Actinidia rufa]
MSTIFRRRTTLRLLTPILTSLSPPSPSHSSLNPPPLSLLELGFRDWRRWHGSSGEKSDQIHAEVDCPRCSRLIGVLFSTRPLSIAAGLTGVYQALNLCPNRRTAFYFQPTKLAPLQGSFVEIERVKGGFGRDEGEWGE